MTEHTGEMLVFTDGDGLARVQVRLQDGSLWLTQRQIAQLFDTTVPNVNQHLSSIYEENELTRTATIKDFLIVGIEGKREVRRNVAHYSLPAIIAVGYRVRSTIEPLSDLFSSLGGAQEYG